MTGQGVMLECSACGNRWTVLPGEDGTMPGGSRCPRSQGGCGKLRKLPRAAARAVVAVAAPSAAWDPPSQPRVAWRTVDECPECRAGLIASPRSTVRLCSQCNELRTPPGVFAPYARGTGATRTAKSQRERDDDAKRTVLAAGEFLRRVAALLDDPRIHPGSADLLRWYHEEITEASRKRDGRRIAELADEFAGDIAAHEFRRAHWWQGEPAAVEPADYADDDEHQADDPAAVMLAIPASIAAQQHRVQRPMMWAEAIAACGYRITVASTGGGAQGCQIVDGHGQQCRVPNPAHGIQYDATGRHAWLCGEHYGTLGGLINNTNETRGMA